MKKKLVASFLLGHMLAYFLMKKLVKEKEEQLAYIASINDKNEIECKRFIQKWNLLNMWIKLENKDLTQTLILKDKNNLAIYGLGELGKYFIKNSIDAEKKIKCIIDKKSSETTFDNIPVFKPNKKLEDIDVVIVSTVLNYEEVIVGLINIVDCPILKLEDIINSAYSVVEN